MRSLSKSLRKVLMIRAKLKNIANKARHPEVINNYNGHINRAVNTDKKEKRLTIQ